jgi:hypothetical protein
LIPPAYVASRSGRITLCVVPARQATWANEINSSESIPGFLKRLQIRVQCCMVQKRSGSGRQEGSLGRVSNLGIDMLDVSVQPMQRIVQEDIQSEQRRVHIHIGVQSGKRIFISNPES